MKPPTPKELRDLATENNQGAEYHRSQAIHFRKRGMLFDARNETSIFREEKLRAMALRRWAEQLRAKA